MSNAKPSSPTTGVIYREKLWPALWLWIVVAGAVTAFGVVFSPMGWTVTFIGCAVIAVILVLLLVAATPTIMVTTQYFQAGRARIEHRYLGAATAYTGDEAYRQRGPALHGLAYLCMRGWVNPVVVVPVLDEQDQTPYWIVSSRRPDQLVKALNTAAEQQGQV